MTAAVVRGSAAVVRGSAAAGRRAGLCSVLAAVAALSLAGCGSITDETASTAFVAPGRFDINTCQEIEKRIKSARERARELEDLMTRSAQGAGGQFVNAIAYQNEYVQTRGQLKAMTDWIADKNCKSQSGWSSERSVF